MGFKNNYEHYSKRSWTLESILDTSYVDGILNPSHIFDNRHGISIIDLEKTYDLLENASKAVEEIISQGKQILLVGTKGKPKSLFANSLRQQACHFA